MDFYDKLVVSITLVVVTIFCVFSNLVFARTSVNLSFFADTSIRRSSGSFDEIVSFPGGNIAYYKIVPGHTYIIDNLSSVALTICSSNSDPYIGLKLDRVNTVSSGSSYSLTVPSDVSYLYIYTSVWAESMFDLVSVYDDTVGFVGVVNSLVSNVGLLSLWSIFSNAVLYIAVVTLVGFGFYLVFRAIRGVSKGRSKI